MRSKVFILISVLIALSNTAFATGLQVIPQSEKGPQIQSVAPHSDATKIIPENENIIVKPFVHEPRIESVLPPKHQAESEPSKLEMSEQVPQAIKVGTSTDIASYQKISLPEAINYALSHNLNIKGERLNVDIAKHNIKKANRLQNPYILSFFNTGKAATDNPNTIGAFFPIDIAKRGARKNLAKSSLELTKGNVALAELMLRLDVRQAYIDLVAAKSNLKILNDQRKLLQELVDVAQKKYDAGAVAQMDVIHAKMTLNQLLIQVNSANTAVFVARYKFNEMLESHNFDTQEDYLPEQNEFLCMLTPKPLAKMPDFDAIFDMAIKNRIDLKNAQKDIIVAQKNLVLVIRQRVPDIELGAGYMFVPSAFSTADAETRGAFLAGNITNIPLLYQYSPEIKVAKLQVEQKQLAYDALIHEAHLSLHTAYDEYLTARDNLNYYNDILMSESQQFLKMAQRSYREGKASITDYIFIEQSYKSIVMGYVQALADYYVAWVNVLRQVNNEELKLNG